ncbi:MAG: STAS domain-containing protein [Burkholderiaceae bacterium]|nr:STAS domain-containing protein [Burkholderiaceae bacterium]
MNRPALPLGPELTIGFAAAWRETLADAVNAGGQVTLDLGEVTDFDSAGVQLLLATQRSLAERGQRMNVAAASPVVRDGLQVFGLQSLLDD